MMTSFQTAGRIPAIDSLRAIAVLSVIIYHLDGRLLPGGFSGVDIFFVISGYVVTRALAHRTGDSLSTYLKDFYVRRILRIFPALLVCLVATVIGEALFVPQSWLSSQNFDTAKFAFFGLSNIFLSTSQEGYFSPRIEFNPYVHTWSLGVEEQFYVILPILYFFCRRSEARASFWTPRNAIIALCVTSIVLSGYYTWNNKPIAYYSLISRFWELGSGALLYEFHRTRRPDAVMGKVARVALFIASVTTLGTGLLISEKQHFPIPYALFSVLGTVGLIHLAVRRTWTMGSGLISGLMVYIGTISYSLYLWHWPVFALVRWTTGLDDWRTKIAALFVVAVFSVASFHLIERPFQRRWFFAHRRSGILIFGVCAICAGAVMAKGVDRARSHITLSVTADKRAWYPYNWSSTDQSAGCHSEAQTELHSGYRHILISRVGCPELQPERTIFVAGDSHAGAYETMLGRLATEHPYGVKLFLMPNCSFFRMDKPSNIETEACQSFVKSSLQLIAHQAKKGDIVFLPSRRMTPFANQWGIKDSKSDTPSLTLAEQAAITSDLENGLSALMTTGASVVLEAPKPVFPSPAFRCSDWFNRMNQVCKAGLEVEAAVLKSRRSVTMKLLESIHFKNEEIVVWDPFPLLCPGKVCRAVEDGNPLFFDGDHLSGYGNLRLLDSFYSVVVSTAK